MSNIFQEFKSIQGYIGGYIFRPGSGIILKDMPSVYKENKLVELGDVLLKTYRSGSLNFSDMIDISICFQEAIIIIRETSGNTFVFLLIDPSANMNLFNMTLSVLMDDISKLEPGTKSEEKSDPKSEPEPDINVAPPESSAPSPRKMYPKSVEKAKSTEQKKDGGPSPKISASEILNDGPLADELRVIQSALSDVTGPIAKVIMLDAVALWAQDFEPSKAHFPELSEILCREINDSEKSEVFKRKLTHILEST